MIRPSSGRLGNTTTNGRTTNIRDEKKTNQQYGVNQSTKLKKTSGLKRPQSGYQRSGNTNKGGMKLVVNYEDEFSQQVIPTATKRY